MNSYYSILKISPNTNLDDAVSVGLLVLTNQRFWFHYSEEKIRLLRPFIPDTYTGIQKLMKMIHRKIGSLESFQLDLYHANQDMFTEVFLQKLAVRNNGMIRFTDPRPLLMTNYHEKNFMDLFDSIIGIYASTRKKQADPYLKMVESGFIRPLKNEIHAGIVLDATMIRNLYFRYTLEGLGRNQDIFLAKYLDFRQTPPTLDKKIMRLLYLNKILTDQYRCNSRIFIVASEPGKTNLRRHRIYDFMARNELLELIDPRECPRLVRIWLDAGMEKFLPDK